MDYATTNYNDFISIHIADLHFGSSIDPLTEYQILSEQFTSKISCIPKIDLVCIDGDLFDHKFMANSDSIYYACKFVDDIVQLSRIKQFTILIINGTFSHDSGQTKLLYHYMEDKSIDVRIIESIKFEYIKNVRVLCIPELYNLEEEVYDKYLNQSGWYNLCILHGTCKGAVYGDNVGQGRLFTNNDFKYCTGPVIAGHVHKPGCFFGYFYYCGSPLRYKFGEEEAKGFLIVAQDLNSNIFYTDFEPIESFRYDTIYLDQLVSEDPKKIIDYINNLKTTQGIDFIKVRFRCKIPGYNQTIINNYYRNNPNTFVEFNVDEDKESIDKQKENSIDNQYNYLLDSSLSDLEKFIRYVNDSEGYQFITIDKLNELLNEAL